MTMSQVVQKIEPELAYHAAYSPEEEAFRDTVRRFIDRHLEPSYQSLGTDTESRHAIWRKAGQAGLLGNQIPEVHGGAGASPLLNMIISHEIARSHCYGTVGSLICTDLSTGILVDGGSEKLIARYAPGIMSGDLIQCMAATEPEAGSDVLSIRATARREDDSYVLNGQKTFITNGDIADIIYVVARTDPERRGASLTMFLVDGSAAGVTRRKLQTMGFPAGNTAEILFDDVVVPAENVLGGVGGAMKLLMGTLAWDRLQISARALGQAELAFEMTAAYARDRNMFGQKLLDYQNSKFVLADIKTELQVGRTMLDEVLRKVRSGFECDEQAAMCKLWVCEMSNRAIDRCLQLFGGMGFMDETPISRIYTSNRVVRVYGGSSETMRQNISRSL